MSEEILRVPLSDGKAIYGRLHGELTSPLIVMVHGLIGNINEHLHYNGARAFAAAGYSVFRFNLYGSQPDARKLIDCTTSLHARDLDIVLQHMKTLQPNLSIAVVGHSLGDLTALLATETYDVLVLWDAAHPLFTRILHEPYYVPELNLYRWQKSIDCLLNPALIEELHELDGNALIAKRTGPVLVIASDESGSRIDAASAYYRNANEPKKLTIISHSDHVFTFGEKAYEVYTETLTWLKTTFPQ